jgi:hypothetical protein
MANPSITHRTRPARARLFFSGAARSGLRHLLVTLWESAPRSERQRLTPHIDPDILAIAYAFKRRHGEAARMRSREIARLHLEHSSDDAEFWGKVAEMVDGIAESGELRV